MTIETQRAEFDAVHDLALTYRRLPAIVDDDYPGARSRYEGRIDALILALRSNGRQLDPTRPAVGPIDFVTAGMRLELIDASAKWPPMNSAHEGFAVLAEEVDELWDHVKVNQKKRDLAAMRKEALQVAAMALRFALDVCDETRGRK